MSSSGSASRNSGLIITGVQSLSSPSPVPGPPPKRKRSSLDVKSLQAASFPQSQAASSIYRIGFLGAGNMARALAEGMIASGEIMTSTICDMARVLLMTFNFDTCRSGVSKQYNSISHE